MAWGKRNVELYATPKPLVTVWKVSGLWPWGGGGGVAWRLLRSACPLLAIAASCLAQWGGGRRTAATPTQAAVNAVSYLIVCCKLLAAAWAAASGALDVFSEFLAVLHYFDSRLPPARELRSRRRTAVLIGLFFGIATILVVLQYWARGTRDGIGVAEVVSAFSIWSFLIFDNMVTLSFVAVVAETWTRFKVLKKRISLAALPVAHWGLSGETKRMAPGASNIRRLYQAHAVLHRAAEILQSHFAVISLMSVASYLLGLVYSSYQGLLLVLSAGGAAGPGFGLQVSMVLCPTLYNLAGILAIVETCSAASREARAVADLVQEVAAVCDPTSALPELAAFVDQVREFPDLVFTAAGLVDLDRKLLVSTLGATITYLVILGQLQ